LGQVPTVHGVERVGQVEEDEGSVDIAVYGLLDLPHDGFDTTGGPHTKLAWGQVLAAAEVAGQDFGGNPVKVLTDRYRPDLIGARTLQWNERGSEKESGAGGRA
jgi:hypothetical protein